MLDERGIRSLISDVLEEELLDCVKYLKRGILDYRPVKSTLKLK